MFDAKTNLIASWLYGLSKVPHDSLYHRGESGYEHSLHVAILCKRHNLDPLFGLLHDIGKMPTCKLRYDKQNRERWSFFDHGEVGADWLRPKKIQQLLNINDEFVDNVQWHLTPYLPHNKTKYGHKRTWIRNQYYKCDKLGGKEPGEERTELEYMLTWPYEDVVKWAYKHRGKYLIGENHWFFDSYVIDNLN